MLYVGRFFFINYSFVSADSCGICEEGKHSEFRRPFPLLALLPSGHGERAVARTAGKAPTADRLPQAATSDALSPKANSPSVCLWRLTGKLSRFSKAPALKFLTFVTQSSSTNVQHTTTKRAQRRGFLGGACGLRNSELAPPKGFLSLQTETKLHIKSTIKNHSTELLHQER